MVYVTHLLTVWFWARLPTVPGVDRDLRGLVVHGDRQRGLCGRVPVQAGQQLRVHGLFRGHPGAPAGEHPRGTGTL